MSKKSAKSVQVLSVTTIKYIVAGKVQLIKMEADYSDKFAPQAVKTLMTQLEAAGLNPSSVTETVRR